jgi:hypothetical protein
MRPLRPTIPSGPRLIGWRERVGLPALGLGPFLAKIDTGARSAALHAVGIRVHGRKVWFRVPHGLRHHHVELHHKGERRIKNTSGRIESRVVIETMVAIGKDSFPVEFTLTDRSDMGVPMLLGRAAVRGRYVVHPGRSFLLSREKKRP